ncbi:MAG: hypothetical protein AB1331_04715 [Bacillota bacterium]
MGLPSPSGQVRPRQHQLCFILLGKGDTRHFLRFNRLAERDPAQLADEIRLLKDLLAAGFRVSDPVASRAGNWVELIDSDLGFFAAVVFTQVKGKPLDLEGMDEGQVRAGVPRSAA